MGLVKQARQILYSIRICGTSFLEVNLSTFLRNNSRIWGKKLGFIATRPFSPLKRADHQIKSLDVKKNKVGGLMLPDFKFYYKTIVIETV